MASDTSIKPALQKPKQKSLTLLYILILIGILIIGFIVAFVLIVCGDTAKITSKSSDVKLDSRQRFSSTYTTNTGTTWYENATELSENSLDKSTNKDVLKILSITTSKVTAKITSTAQALTTISSSVTFASESSSSSPLITTALRSTKITSVTTTSSTTSVTSPAAHNDDHRKGFSLKTKNPSKVLSEYAKDVPDQSLESKTHPFNDTTPSLYGEILENKNFVKTTLSDFSENGQPLGFEHHIDPDDVGSPFDSAEGSRWPHIVDSKFSTSDDDDDDLTVEENESVVAKKLHQNTDTQAVPASQAPVRYVTTAKPQELLPYHEFKKKFMNNFATTETTTTTKLFYFQSKKKHDNRHDDHNGDFRTSVNPSLPTLNKDVDLNLADVASPEPEENEKKSTSLETFPISTETSLPLVEEYIPTCVSEQLHTCPINKQVRDLSHIHFPTEQSAKDAKHFGGIQPVHYSLNLTVHRGSHTLITGDISITLKVANETSTIFVNVGRSLSELDVTQIYVFSCSTGRVICAETVTQYRREELLVIQLAESLLKGETVVLRVSNFRNPRAQEGVIVQAPQRWDSKRPWAVASFFQFRKARAIFPCIDVPTFKSPMDLCITHPQDSNARSNTGISSQSESDGSIMTCFKRTPKMSTYLYAFAVYDRLQSQTMDGDLESNIPELEILYPRQMNNDKPSWIRSEAVHALKYMEEYTGFPYPINKLTLLATPLPVQGMENFGLILLNEKWVEYPMFAVSHAMLAHEIVHQWIGNIVTVNAWEELCLQEGLSSYIGYKVNEATTAAELSEAYNKIRELQEKRLRGIERDSRSRMPVIGEFQTYEDALRCFDKPVLFFEMLSDGFGTDVVKKFTRSLVQKYAFKNAGLDIWKELISEAAGNHLAGKFLKDFFTRPGIPLLRTEYKSNEIKVFQTVAVEGRKTLNKPFVVPIIASQGPSNPRIHLLINESEQTFPFVTTEPVILDPDSKCYAILIYEAEVYARLLRCLQMDNCNYVNNETIAHILKDFCWAFLNDHLTVTNSGPNSLKLWRDLTKQLSTSPMVRGTCACCMDKKLKKSGDVYCKWHWKDHCESIQLVKELQRLV